MLADRVDKPLSIGLEGAGEVVAAGKNAGHLLGKTVAALSLAQGMFARYRTLPAAGCVPLPDGTTAADGADLFVNPLTALAIVESARLDGYTGLIHTAAASNLGQMLVKICRDDSIPLVNVVRREEHVALLRDIGASHVCNSSLPGFRDDLLRAVQDTGAMVAFDATGGGPMADLLLKAMEAAAASRMPAYSPYGSSEHKQVNVYGHLDHSPIQLTYEGYGLSWSVTGWSMPPILERAGRQRAGEIQQRVVRELKTTFASSYAREVSLAQMLERDAISAYTRKATGEKYLVRPSL